MRKKISRLHTRSSLAPLCGTSSCFSMTSTSGTEQSSLRETWALVSRSVKRSTRDAEHDPRRQVRFYTTTNPPLWNLSPSQRLAPPSNPPSNDRATCTPRPDGFQSSLVTVLMWSLLTYETSRKETPSKIVRFSLGITYLLNYMCIYVNSFIGIQSSDIFSMADYYAMESLSSELINYNREISPRSVLICLKRYIKL